MNQDDHSVPTGTIGKASTLLSQPVRGRILRLKSGYNPNSSSIGSVVFLLSTKMLAFSGSFGIAAGLIYSYFERLEARKRRRRGNRGQDEGAHGVG